MPGSRHTPHQDYDVRSAPLLSSAQCLPLRSRLYTPSLLMATDIHTSEQA